MSRSKSKLKLSSNAVKVLEKRYLKKDGKGKVIESPEEMFRRVAKNVASADATYAPEADLKETEEEFYEVMTALNFISNSPTLMNAGRELQQLSACFVLPIEDSMESIFETIKNTALIHKSGGGTGFSFSRLRPKDDIVQSTKGVSSGPISFMNVFDAATEAIKQGGTRRGANMAILDVTHPDILDFIVAKKEEGKLSNFNISVGITEDFMKRVIKNEEYHLINPHTKKVVGKLNAREVFNLMVEMAWSNGEPGIIFLDRIDRYNPTPKLGRIESTNPCGEQALLPYESCNLGSINLSNMVENGKINYKKLAKTVETAVHFLDNVIDVNKYPLNEIERMTKGNRKIGLGVMGFADMLIKLDIAYNSEKAIALAGKIMSFILKEAREASLELAKIRDVFPNFRGSIYDVKDGLRVRNATTTTIAPTGTISIIANCSSGIEPIFALSYVRNILGGEELIEINPLFEKVAKEEGFYSDELMRKIAETGTIQGMEEIPKEIQKVFVTALDISPEWHIKMQSEFQKYIDNAVSKTVNFPKTASRKDVEKVYMLAYELECKGVTIYRYGSRKEQVLSLSKKKEDKLIPRARPSITKGRTIRMQTGCGYLYVTINEDEEGLFEVFAQLGKGGGCAASQTEAISRLVSLALRSGVDTQSIIKQLKDIRCPSPIFVKGGKIFSCPDAIAKAIGLYLTEEKAILEERTTLDDYKGSVLAKGNVVGICPDCGSPLIHEEGCMVCIDKTCGYSKCG